MKIYWSMSSIPELAPFSRKERREIWQASAWRALRKTGFWVGMVLFGLSSELGSIVGQHFGYGSIGSLIGKVIGLFFLVQFWTQAALPAMRSVIEARRKSA